MSEVGTTHEDLERFLAEHYLVGAGLSATAAPRRARAKPRRIGNGMAFIAVCSARGRSSPSGPTA